MMFRIDITTAKLLRTSFSMRKPIAGICKVIVIKGLEPSHPNPTLVMHASSEILRLRAKITFHAKLNAPDTNHQHHQIKMLLNNHTSRRSGDAGIEAGVIGNA